MGLPQCLCIAKNLLGHRLKSFLAPSCLFVCLWCLCSERVYAHARCTLVCVYVRVRVCACARECVYARARASYDIIKKEPKLNSLIPDPNPATFPKKIRGGGKCVWGCVKKNE